MFKNFFLLLLLNTTLSHSQTYVKMNGVTALLLMPHLGIETSVSKKVTFQVDVISSFWKSFNDSPLQFAVLTPEFRYHFNEKNKGIYIGGHVGFGLFKLKKWNYDSNRYQKGFSYFMGATLGYKMNLTKKLVLDFFVGGGNQQAFYHGYYVDTGLKYETADKYNKSGEFIPYRAGVMICYPIN